jgi:hypothetical protein
LQSALQPLSEERSIHHSLVDLGQHDGAHQDLPTDVFPAGTPGRGGELARLGSLVLDPELFQALLEGIDLFRRLGSHRVNTSLRDVCGSALPGAGEPARAGLRSQRVYEYLGRCHCGALSVRYRTHIAPALWSVRECQCSFCRSHGALSSSDPGGELEFRATDPTLVQRYRFGGRTTDFLLCRVCGVYLGAQTVVPEGRFGVLNVRCLRPYLKDLPAPEPMQYEAESAEARQQRRTLRWTPVTADSL